LARSSRQSAPADVRPARSNLRICAIFNQARGYGRLNRGFHFHPSRCINVRHCFAS
jgi:hypothetical protein